MSLPKEIAEKVIKGKEYITSIDTEPRILARAYLELEKEIIKLKKSREVLREAHIKNSNPEAWDYDEVAREAIKADDEIMK